MNSQGQNIPTEGQKQQQTSAEQDKTQGTSQQLSQQQTGANSKPPQQRYVHTVCF